MRLWFILALVIAVSNMVATLALAQQASAQTRDWSKAVTQTPEGGYRMGNPGAPVKLIEYGSLGCPTCARFAAEGHAPLLAQIRNGTVSFEFRNYVLNAPDMAAALLSRCAGPANYFRLNETFFTAQPQWFARLKTVPQARLTALQKLPYEKQLGQFATLTGIDAIAIKAGFPSGQVQQCLTNEDGIDQLVRMKRAAWATYRVSGTPTFIVNGRRADGVLTWAGLAPLLKPSQG